MTLVKRTFALFLAAFLLQLALLSGLIYFGYTHSEGQWRTMRIAAIQETARTILLTGNSRELPQDLPISIYDSQGNLAATNRGTGRGRAVQEIELIPVRDAGRVIGYYSAGQVSFRSDAASRELIETMTRVLLVGVLLSLGISLAAAAYFSRQISMPAQKISASLLGMIRGDRKAQAVQEGVEEISNIGRSVNTLQNQLTHEQEIRSQWAQDIAHDLRTPVSSMKAQLEAMSDGVLPVTPERIERTAKELNRMESLIRDLEMLMKLESPEMNLTWAEIDAESFSQDLISRFSDGTGSIKPVTPDIQVSTFHGDEQLLYRAVSNLLANALRHAGPGTDVTLGIRDTGGSIVISVHNFGEPIPAGEISQVFDRLFRGEYARKTPGSGLGLTIVKRISELHNGRIAIKSTSQDGTIISIMLPN